MRWATVLVVRVLANGCSELAHPRKLFCIAGFQPASLPLRDNAGWPSFVRASRMPALPLISQRHYGVNGSQKNQRQRKRNVHQQPAVQPSVQEFLAHQLPGFVADAEEIVESGMRDRRHQAAQRGEGTFRELRIAEALALPGGRFEKRAYFGEVEKPQRLAFFFGQQNNFGSHRHGSAGACADRRGGAQWRGGCRDGAKSGEAASALAFVDFFYEAEAAADAFD